MCYRCGIRRFSFKKSVIVSLVLLALLVLVLKQESFQSWSSIQIQPSGQWVHIQHETRRKQEGERDELHSERHSSSPGAAAEPMALSLDYWEQTANAMSSLLDLQCWARSAGIGAVLLPSLDVTGRSVFHFTPDEAALTFGNLYDIDHWNTMSIKLHYSPLVSRGYFLQHASKSLVYVHIEYQNGNTHKECVMEQDHRKVLVHLP